MYKAVLRKVGGSVMLAVPPAILELLRLGAGATVGIAVSDGRLVIEPQEKPRYSLEALLAACDPAADQSAEEQEWLHAKPVGRELL